MQPAIASCSCCMLHSVHLVLADSTAAVLILLTGRLTTAADMIDLGQGWPTYYIPPSLPVKGIKTICVVTIDKYILHPVRKLNTVTVCYKVYTLNMLHSKVDILTGRFLCKSKQAT